MRQCFSPCYQQRRSNGKKPDVPSWLPWNKQLFCHWQQWESIWLLHPSIQNQCFLLCYVFSGSAQTQIIMFLPFEDEEFARGKFSSCVMLSAQLWSFGGCDPPSDVHAQLCAFEPCRSTQGCVRARHIGFLQPAMRLWSQLLLLAPQLEWLHRCWWRWVRSSAHPQSKAWVCTALCLAGHLHCSTAVLKPKEWVTIKCRSLQPEGNLPVMDSNTPIGLFRSLRCLNSCSLIFKHFSSRDLKVLCEL